MEKPDPSPVFASQNVASQVMPQAGRDWDWSREGVVVARSCAASVFRGPRAGDQSGGSGEPDAKAPGGRGEQRRQAAGNVIKLI
jgi:hypothetical protein